MKDYAETLLQENKREARLGNGLAKCAARMEASMREYQEELKILREKHNIQARESELKDTKAQAKNAARQAHILAAVYLIDQICEILHPVFLRNNLMKDKEDIVFPGKELLDWLELQGIYIRTDSLYDISALNGELHQFIENVDDLSQLDRQFTFEYGNHGDSLSVRFYWPALDGDNGGTVNVLFTTAALDAPEDVVSRLTERKEWVLNGSSGTVKDPKIEYLKQPMTDEEAEAMADANEGLVSGVIRVELSELIDLDMESMYELVDDRMLRDKVACTMTWKIVGYEPDVLYLQVECRLYD